MIRITMFLLTLLFVACSQNKSQSEESFGWRSFEVLGHDTCNVTDAKGRKQGRWLIYSHSGAYKVTDTLYYKDNVQIGHP